MCEKREDRKAKAWWHEKGPQKLMKCMYVRKVCTTRPSSITKSYLSVKAITLKLFPCQEFKDCYLFFDC